ncbi:MAG: copper chaperone [Desulfobacteraceae bacterium]|nr:MAG: copper chaperone [Desulfobacteraceae bacterium]
MRTAKFKIEGMHCDGCAQIIQSLLEKKTGVRAADVTFNEREARILYETQLVAEDQLVEAIEKAGYRVGGKL